ncbi:pyocin knob domain-containing protein [Lactococcus lactis]
MSYEKQTWNKYDELKTEEENIENGAVVTDNRMNHMESGIGDNDANLASHLADKNNPHKVTAAQVGLGNVQNFGLATEDEAKQGISNAKYMTPSLTQAVLSANINSIAYANSADGTDDFTTVYPNLNLLTNSSAKTKDGFFKNFDKVENGYGEVTISGTNTWVSKNLWDGFSIQPRSYKPGDVYTMSMDVMFTSWNLPAGTSITEFWIGQRYSSGGGINSYKQICAIDLPRDPSQILNQWIRITKTSTIPPYLDPAVNTEALFMTRFTGASAGSFTVRVRNPKQEPGSNATLPMPSSSEATTADWPNYVGFSNTVKTNKSASDYTWFPVKDSELTNKVDSHVNNKANPHAVTASQVGAYSKTESDSKLTDLSNKVIANKGNLASGTDLDNVIDNGTYRIGGLTGETDIINVPSERSGTTIYAYLTVSGTTTSVVQELIVYDSKTVSQIYSRSRSGSTPTFSPWSKTVMADDSGKVKVTDLEVSGTIKRINDADWTSLGNFTSIKREGNTVTVKVVNGTRTTAGDITLGTIPTECRPVDSVMTLVPAWSAGTTNDKHVQLNGSSMAAPGGMTILSAAANAQYTFQFKYEI